MFRSRPDPYQKDMLDQVVLTAYVAELAEWDNRAHSERMRRYTYLLATGCEIAPGEAELLSLAAILHDVGKIRLPAAILRKTASLEADEYELVTRHAEDGARILEASASPVMQAAATIALTHHERWDGSGYPRGLKAEAIPLSGRIVALADVFDALTTRRAYKTVVEPEAALDLIKESAGILFDPGLVSILVERFQEFRAVLLQKLLGTASAAVAGEG